MSDAQTTPRCLVIWGAGTLGGRVAPQWTATGGPVHAFTRTQTRHEALRQAGAEPHLNSPVGVLGADDALLLALPGSAAQLAAVEALAGTPPPARAVLCSSTGYYGRASGPVDEDTAPGDDPRAAAVVRAERAFAAWAGPHGVILRIGGLYESGRGPMSALAHRGAPPLGPPDKTLALIHYDDAATICFEALRHPAPLPVYLAVTPPCPSRYEFYLAACVVLGLDEPMFDDPLRQPQAEFDVHRLRRDLVPHPAHPKWQGALLP